MTSVPTSVCNLFFSLLFQANSYSSLWFLLSLHFPGNVCLPSWAYVTASLVPNTREGLNAHLCPVATNGEGLPSGAAQPHGGQIYHFPRRGLPSPQGPAKASLKNGKAKRTSFEVQEGLSFLSAHQADLQSLQDPLAEVRIKRPHLSQQGHDLPPTSQLPTCISHVMQKLCMCPRSVPHGISLP